MSEVTLYQEMTLDDRKSYAFNIGMAARMLPSGIRGTSPEETAAQAFLIMETGSMLGLHPIAALSSVNIIEGKPAMSADLMVSVARAAGHTVRISETGTVEGGDYAATVTVIRRDDPDNPISSTWSPKRAARAGLCRYEQERDGSWTVRAASQKGKPLPWQLYTEALCKARAKSEAVRDAASDNLNGVRYTPEELGADVDAHGELVAGSVAEAPTPAASPEPAALPPATKRATKGRQGTRRKKAEAEAPAEVVVEEVAEVVAQETAPSPAPVPEPAAAPVDDERTERARMAAEQERQVSERERIIATAADVDRADEAAVAAWNAEHGRATGHLLTSDAERAARAGESAPADVPAALDIPEFVDGITGDVYPTQEALDAAVRARVEAKRAARSEEPAAAPQASAYEVATQEEPENFQRRAEAATASDELRQVWEQAQAAGAMTTDLSVLIINRKSEVEAGA